MIHKPRAILLLGSSIRCRRRKTYLELWMIHTRQKASSYEFKIICPDSGSKNETK